MLGVSAKGEFVRGYQGTVRRYIYDGERADRYTNLDGSAFVRPKRVVQISFSGRLI